MFHLRTVLTSLNRSLCSNTHTHVCAHFWILGVHLHCTVVKCCTHYAQRLPQCKITEDKKQNKLEIGHLRAVRDSHMGQKDLLFMLTNGGGTFITFLKVSVLISVSRNFILSDPPALTPEAKPNQTCTTITSHADRRLLNNFLHHRLPSY